MRFPSTLLALPVVLGASLAACGGDDDDRATLDASTASDAGGLDGGDGLVPVTLRFKAKVGADDLACGRSYAAQGSGQVAGKVQDFRLFLQDVALIAEDGRTVPVTLDERAPYQTRDLALLDFTDAKDGCVAGDPGSNTVVTGRVPPGRYRGLRFVNGVPTAINHGDPATAAAPLRMPGVNWNWLQGNRFVIAEMVRAPDAMDGGVVTATDAGAPSSGGGGHNASSATPGLAIVHVGSTNCGGSTATGFTCAKPNRNAVALPGFDPAVNTVVADLGAVFAGTDLDDGLLCHAAGAQCAAPLSALGIDVATGAPLATQQVFRFE
ncbi:MAG: MbnP family copper-binding protein [Polyangiales bacterium]